MPYEEEQKIFFDGMVDIELTEAEIAALRTRHLRDRAEQLLLPVPVHEEDTKAWEQSKFTGRYHYTTATAAKLQGEIRAARRVQLEPVYG